MDRGCRWRLVVVVGCVSIGGAAFACTPRTAVVEVTPASVPPASVVSPTPAAAASGRTTCVVSRVHDGDTIEVAGCVDAGPVRLLLLDSPELGGATCFAREAATFVRERLAGREVQLEADAEDLDRYGRRLRYVWLNGVLFNEEIARGGYARLLVYGNPKYTARIAAAVEEARAASRGLWGACGTGSCTGDVRITALDKRAEFVRLEGAGDLTGWVLVSARGAATQHYGFANGFLLAGSVEVVSGVAAFPATPSRLWWTSDTVWSNSDDDNALLYDDGGQLVCEFEDGQ